MGWIKQVEGRKTHCGERVERGETCDQQFEFWYVSAGNRAPRVLACFQPGGWLRRHRDKGLETTV